MRVVKTLKMDLLNELGNNIFNKTMQKINGFISNELNKPEFWNKKIGLLSIVFYPLTFLVLIFIFLKKNFLVKKNLKFQLFA